jgi:hypothetical protein
MMLRNISDGMEENGKIPSEPEKASVLAFQTVVIKHLPG